MKTFKTEYNNRTEWHNELGQLVVKYQNGLKKYYLNGKLHRTNGPAIEYPDGSNAYYLYGKRHRLDGPAVNYTNGYKAYYINGTQYSELEFNFWAKCIDNQLYHNI